MAAKIDSKCCSSGHQRRGERGQLGTGNRRLCRLSAIARQVERGSERLRATGFGGNRRRHRRHAIAIGDNCLPISKLQCLPFPTTFSSLLPNYSLSTRMPGSSHCYLFYRRHTQAGEEREKENSVDRYSETCTKYSRPFAAVILTSVAKHFTLPGHTYTVAAIS